MSNISACHRILNTVKRKKDECILLEMQTGKDAIVPEIAYRPSCYKAYTVNRPARETSPVELTTSTSPYEQAFTKLVNSLQAQLFDHHFTSVFSMNHLCQEMFEYLASEDINTSPRVPTLKNRLLLDFDNLERVRLGSSSLFQKSLEDTPLFQPLPVQKLVEVGRGACSSNEQRSR